MASLRLTPRVSGHFLPRSAFGPRAFVTGTRPLQKAKIEEEKDKKIMEAADVVKDGAKEVISTCKFVKNKVENVSKAAENFSEKVAVSTVEKIKDKIFGK